MTRAEAREVAKKEARDAEKAASKKDAKAAAKEETNAISIVPVIFVKTVDTRCECLRHGQCDERRC